MQNGSKQMRFLCQVWLDGKRLDALPKPQRDAFEREVFTYDRKLIREGKLVLAHALHPPEAAVTVTVRKGHMSRTDGPFTETKEFLAGFMLMEARDIDEAIALAAGSPIAEFSRIEVREAYPLRDEPRQP